MQTSKLDRIAPIRVLLVADDEDDYVLTREMLSAVDGTLFELEWVKCYDEGVRAMVAYRHDLYLVDFCLGAHSGLELLEDARKLGCEAPIVMLTGTGGADIDMQAMKLGADDYLVKDRLAPELLGRSIRYAIERKRTENELAFLARYDPLTGLANRALFRDLLKSAIARAIRSDNPLAVMFVDLDGFKLINDSLGHALGDQLLQQVAGRLKDTVREVDAVARMAGDEFIVILEDVPGIRQAAILAERIIASLAQPVRSDGHEVFTTASIGIAATWGGNWDLDTLINNADMAMYRAKNEGRNSYQFYAPEMTALAIERMTLENDLRHALERDEVTLHYQPLIDLRTDTVFGVEALVRWQHPERGLIPPDKFLPVAEDTGLIGRLGEWVLRRACLQNREWLAAGFPSLRIAVNLSARQFLEDGLQSSIEGALSQNELDPEDLDLELTEGHLARSVEKSIENLAALKATGIRISIDDFGTGYSSLSHLKRFPIDTLKIDRSFVQDISSDSGDTAIATAIIALARSLDLDVIAEGVETEGQLAVLRELGCDAVQGYLLARPMAPEPCARWFAERHSGSVAAMSNPG